MTARNELLARQGWDASSRGLFDAPEIRDRLRTKLDLFRNSLQRGEPEMRQRLSRDEQDQLRALGYVEETTE